MSTSRDKLIEAAKKLDRWRQIDSDEFYFKKVNEIINNRSDTKKVSELYQHIYKLQHVHKKNKLTPMLKELSDALACYLGYSYISEIFEKEADSKKNSSLDDLMNELNQLVGLPKVKEEVRRLVIYQKIQAKRKESGLKVPKRTLHMAFMGNPGTGKTTVARIVGRMYYQLGLLSKGHFTEVSRTDLIAGYQGQTALKVKNVIEKAKGGVLFIDEAYSITENDNTDSYGRECLTELTKALEDSRDDLIVIVAGYTEPMNHFFESNPGLRSRFNYFINFENYSSTELIDILETLARKDDYQLSDELKERLSSYFTDELETKVENFSNGRFIRNLYEDLIMNQAVRLNNNKQYSSQELSLLKLEDFIS
jgi:stage V sporulation protein K